MENKRPCFKPRKRKELTMVSRSKIGFFLSLLLLTWVLQAIPASVFEMRITKFSPLGAKNGFVWGQVIQPAGLKFKTKIRIFCNKAF